MEGRQEPWRIKYDGSCAQCGRELRKGEPAVYERASRTIRCIECPTAIEPTTHPESGVLPIDVGIAGASARREHERRHAKREGRIKGRFGERVGGVVLAVTTDPQSTRAWERGAEGEERLAETLAGLDGIVALHDRRVPGTRGNIDHLVVAPAGVFVIDAKHYAGQVRIRDRGSLFRRDDRLYVGGRDCSKLAEGLGWQVEAVERALSGESDGAVPVTPVLCFIDAEWPLFRPPKSFRGVLLEGPRSVRSHLSAGAALSPARIDRVAATLAGALPAH